MCSAPKPLQARFVTGSIRQHILVMTGTGEFIEMQGTGEESTFNDAQLAAMLESGKAGIRELLSAQLRAIEAA